MGRKLYQEYTVYLNIRIGIYSPMKITEITLSKYFYKTDTNPHPNSPNQVTIQYSRDSDETDDEFVGRARDDFKQRVYEITGAHLE